MDEISTSAENAQIRLEGIEKQMNLISISPRLDKKFISDEGNKTLETIINYNKSLSFK